jgi:hypothetical protein
MINLYENKAPEVHSAYLREHDVLFVPSGAVIVVTAQNNSTGVNAMCIRKDDDRPSGRVSYQHELKDKHYSVNQLWRDGEDIVAKAADADLLLKHTEKQSMLIVTGAAMVRRIAGKLVTRSCWFEIVPLPDDQWELRTKKEGHLRIVCDEMGLYLVEIA